MCPKLFKKRFEKSHNNAPLNECTVPVLTPNLMNGFPLCTDHSKDLKYEKMLLCILLSYLYLFYHK